jgi:DNA invertase Pin-like site-specific DNA recombinase
MERLFVAYYRVSTEKTQGAEGLGLQSQKPHVTRYINENGVLLGEFQDVESGSNNDRKEFKKALAACKASGATLVVYDVSRLSRGGFEMMYEIQKSGIPFVESSAPNDSSFSKNIKFLVASEELQRISTNTKKALGHITAKLERGEEHISKSGRVVTHLGSPQNLTDYSRQRSAEVRRERANNNPNNVKAAAFMKVLREANGKITYAVMAQKLNESGFQTSTGGKWSAMQASRVFKRLNE